MSLCDQEQYKYIYTTLLEALYCGQIRWSQKDFMSQYYQKVDGDNIPSDMMGQFKVGVTFVII